MSRDGNIAIAAPAEGGCLCGAIRYRVTPCSADSGYCHCRTCQRSAGAPAMAWVSIQRTHLSLTQGTPKRFRSSSHAERHFCDACGTQLFFSDDRATSIDINIPTLDNPDLTPPRYHIWRMSRLSWFDTADTLPRFDDRGYRPVIKLTFCLVRLPALSREAFQDYWRNTHAPLVARHREVLRIRRYIQLHSFDPAVSAITRASRGGPEQYDGVAQLWWNSMDDVVATTTDPDAIAAGRDLLADERKFIDLARSPLWWGEEHTIFG